MNPQTITEKIYAAADAELLQTLRNKFYEIRKEFTDGSSKVFTARGGYVSDADNRGRTLVADAHDALSALEVLSFDVQREKNRDNKLNEFMSKVERLGTEIDDIRSSIGQL